MSNKRDDEREYRHGEDRKRERRSSSLREKLTTAIACILFLIVGLAIGKLFLTGAGKKGPDVTADFISSRIEEASRLTTAEMTYRGVVHFSDGEIPLLTRKHFNMIYEAKVGVGIDVSQIESEVTEDQIIIRLPDAAVQGEVNVLPESLQFYDEQDAIFNAKDNKDVQAALTKAKEDATLNANVEGIRETAEQHAKELIRALLPPELTGDRQVVFE